MGLSPGLDAGHHLQSSFTEIISMVDEKRPESLWPRLGLIISSHQISLCKPLSDIQIAAIRVQAYDIFD